MIQASPLWNTLEIAKLIVSALTPLMVVIVGLWISRSLKRLEYLSCFSEELGVGLQSHHVPTGRMPANIK